MRYPLEVVRAVREEVGPGFPIAYRFSQWKMDDYREVKWRTPEELETWVVALRAAGVDILHVSARDALDPGFEEHGSLSLAGWTRRLSGLPVIAVGKVSVTLAMDEAYGAQASTVRDPSPHLEMIERGEADLLAVGRSLIPNPDWVKIVRDGDWRTLEPFHKRQLATLQ
jgi:2,4-dienoyl-CoA reductase-like NADH-dependent reductase (Old Yellow Enzyme family)